MIKFLTDDKITANVKELLSEGGVAVVAYVGKNARNMLSKDTIVICDFNSFGTNPNEIAWLIEKKYDVRSLANLHAKVYCSEFGAIVGSANLSANGLELLDGTPANLTETAVLVSADEKAYRDIYNWCQEIQIKVKKGNISGDEISRRVEEWNLLALKGRRGHVASIPSIQNYREFRKTVLIVPINGGSDIENNEDKYEDETGTALKNYLKRGTGWVEGAARPKHSKQDVQPIVKALDGKRIIFFYFETDSNQKVIESVELPDKSERGIFKYRNVITVAKKKFKKKFVYLYDRTEVENKEYVDDLKIELENLLIGKSPDWLYGKESESNRWFHFTIDELLNSYK